MNTTHREPDARLVAALAGPDSSARLRAALAAGTDGDVRLAEILVARCAVEPDFFVRDMLTWALCRMPAEMTVPMLLTELDSGVSQARSQALHTLSKIGDRSAWPQVAGMLHDVDEEVALSAWRAGAALVPPGSEPLLAAELAKEFGRGSHSVQRSLSRALVTLGDAADPVIDAAADSADPHIRAHAEATRRLRLDPESGFTLSLEFAKRVAATGTDGRQREG